MKEQNTFASLTTIEQRQNLVDSVSQKGEVVEVFAAVSKC
jgi:hypothetical protein